MAENEAGTAAKVVTLALQSESCPFISSFFGGEKGCFRPLPAFFAMWDRWFGAEGEAQAGGELEEEEKKRFGEVMDFGCGEKGLQTCLRVSASPGWSCPWPHLNV